MAIVIRLDVMMARRKMRLNDLAARVDLGLANLSNLKNGKIKAIRLATLNELCHVLDCQPGDLLEYEPGPQGDDGEP